MLDTKRRFTRSDAVAAGISPRRLGGSRFRRIFRGVYISSAVRPAHRERVTGALLLFPEGAWASHMSAAYWCGVVVPQTSLVHVSVRRIEDRRWQPGLKPHLAPSHTRVRRHDGILVSDPVRMYIELASVLDLVDLVVAGDFLIRVFKMKSEEPVAALDQTRDYWSPAARHAARFVRDGVDSPMETRLRMVLVRAGLPEPEVNFTLRDVDGHILARFDLSYPRLRIIVEYDGHQHLGIIENWENDPDRREFLDNEEWRVLRVTSRGIYAEPGRTIERVWPLLRKRGLILPLPVDDWRPRFPGRKPAA
jgi:very-short-patch-repair endonuclease